MAIAPRRGATAEFFKTPIEPVGLDCSAGAGISRQSVWTGIRLISGSVKMSRSSRLLVENSETTAPSGPPWNQCLVFAGR